MLLELLTIHHSLLTIKVHFVPPCGKENVLSNDTVLQQRLKVLVAGSRGTLLVAAGKRRVDVDASQRGHRLFAVQAGLVIEGQLRGGGGAGGFLWDEERNEKGDDHGTCTQQEGRPGDERSLGCRNT